MHGINLNRWLLGGVVAGVVTWLLEGLGSGLYLADMQAAMTAHGLSMDALAPSAMVLSIVFSLIAGLVLIFLYAAARPRFGPGPGTAAKVAVAMWLGGYALALAGYYMLGLFPTRMLVLWAAVGLVEFILAAIAGAWVYREEGPGGGLASGHTSSHWTES